MNVCALCYWRWWLPSGLCLFCFFILSLPFPAGSDSNKSYLDSWLVVHNPVKEQPFRMCFMPCSVQIVSRMCLCWALSPTWHLCLKGATFHPGSHAILSVGSCDHSWTGEHICVQPQSYCRDRKLPLVNRLQNTVHAVCHKQTTCRSIDMLYKVESNPTALACSQRGTCFHTTLNMHSNESHAALCAIHSQQSLIAVSVQFHLNYKLLTDDEIFQVGWFIMLTKPELRQSVIMSTSLFTICRFPFEVNTRKC